jgi:hypothetical protein
MTNIVCKALKMETFLIPGHVGMCNALRRTLLSDIITEAPGSIEMILNVTCHTDEFLAHRIGLIPFRRVGNGNEMTLKAKGPCVVTAAQFLGPAFEPVHENIEVLKLATGHELHLKVTFDAKKASEHARYSPCFAVGMKPSSKEDVHVLSFGSNDHRSPSALLDEAFEHLLNRVDAALLCLADDKKMVSFI